MLHSKTSPSCKGPSLMAFIAITFGLAMAFVQVRWSLKHSAEELARCQGLRQDVGRVLAQWPWVKGSDVIARELDVLSRRYVAIGPMLDRGEADLAWVELGHLNAALGNLAVRNALAEQVARSRSRLTQARDGLSEKQRAQADADPVFASLVLDAEQAWKEGDWANARRLFELAYEKDLARREGLRTTPDELVAGPQAEGVAPPSTEIPRLQGRVEELVELIAAERAASATVLQAKSKAESERDVIRQDARSKAQLLASRDRELVDERARRAAAEKRETNLSRAVIGLDSQIKELQGKIVQLETRLRTANTHELGGDSPRNPFTIGGRNSIKPGAITSANNPYATQSTREPRWGVFLNR
jgi:hypothetical protein